ncbi:hypothetical protein CspeluHIS016_0402560 [Cutaneotrichosporon spelunceum]|uniref:pyridoxal 5'-phosphate synthase n=1 Tax=Cutaneotrichosporon spelunceum TaxID=1672016 RepID=A0AAD3TV00_9TREE|nr:hypothetical protein CspeluHIS016_0402560 [Cutaneotrichosporon spelunceum]
MPHQGILSPIARTAAAAEAAAASSATATIATPTGFRLTAHNQYNATRLDAAHLPADPFPLFRLWLHEALVPTHAQPAVREPEAMTLSTAASGIPSSRVVLLKEVDDRGFLFYTNYESRKAHELESGHAALSFYWREVSRQVSCPPHWGGYRVVPTEIEFWAGQPSRLHDRFVYTRPDTTSTWTVERRAP